MRLWSRFFPEGWNSTIRTKLTTIFTLLIAVISVFIFIFFPARLKNQATEAIVAKAQTIAEMTAYGISPALFFEDIENIEEVLKSTRQNKDLVYIMLLNDSGETVAVFNKDKADQANFIRAKNNNYISPDGMTYNIMTPILHNAGEIGQLYLGLSLKELEAEISRSRATIALVSVMIFIVGMVAVFGISTLVTGPLSQMAKTVEQISQGDLTQRAAVSSQDEVGQLAQSFNLMVDSLESAHRELKDLNASLEERVIERTKELQQEIDERRRAEEALRKSEEKYRNIFENIAEGIYQTTPEGKILLVNPAMVKMLGYDSANELMQINVKAGYQSPADRRKFEKLMEKYGQVKGFEANWKKKDGTTLIVREKAHVVRDDEGKILYYEGTSEDITERKLLEKQLLQSQKMEAVGTLVGGIAHDFNNILTAVQGYTQLALMTVQEDDPLYRTLNGIRKAAIRAANLIRQLLLFSRRQPMELTPIDLNKVIDDLTKMLNRLIGEDISLNTDLESDLRTVKADTGSVEQAITNLVVNARDALPEGGEITIKTENVPVDKEYCKTYRDARPGKFVCLSVQDTGIGMDQATIERIFEPFFSTKGVGKGSGLGLSVVYGIVKQHEGWINVESSPDNGAIFRIYLPAVFVRPREEQKTTVSLESFKGEGERILLVEDEKFVRDPSTKMLSENGYVVSAAANVQEALDIFEREEGNFDLIFCDVVLPDGRGPKLVEWLLKRKPQIRVLFTSGYSREKSNWRAIQKGGYQFLSKPYLLADLLKALKEVLKKK